MSELTLVMTRILHYHDAIISEIALPSDRPPIYALELPWRDNRRNVSCIPAGRYQLIPAVKQSGDKTRFAFRLLDVPGRDGIMIHIGNTAADTRGCILPGLDWRSPEMDGRRISSVQHSTAAMQALVREMIAGGWLRIEERV